jgi:hypothetical protein
MHEPCFVHAMSCILIHMQVRQPSGRLDAQLLADGVGEGPLDLGGGAGVHVLLGALSVSGSSKYRQARALESSAAWIVPWRTCARGVRAT